MNRNDWKLDSKGDKLEPQIAYFESSLKSRISYFNEILIWNQSLNLPQNNNITATTTFTQPALHYNEFLESGLDVFINVIDVYQLWLEPSDITPLLKSSQPGLLSFTFIALLARYTIPKTSSLYPIIYKNSLSNAKRSLPTAYSNPSINNVIALGLLACISMSHFKINLTIRYFGAAVRMAQSLGLDKLEDDKLSNDFSSKEEERAEFKRKGIRLWEALSFTYMILSVSMPNLPSFNFAPKPFNLITLNRGNKPLEITYSNIGSTTLERKGFFTSDSFMKLTEVFMGISCHIQKVKLDYSNIEVSKIPPQSLRLPLFEFSKSITTLLSTQGQYSSEGSIQSNSSHEQAFSKDDITIKETTAIIGELESFNIRQMSITEALFIYLYYPNILVYPQPVELTKDEEMILFKGANIITNCYFRIYQYETTIPQPNKSQEQPSSYEVHYKSLQYLQCLCPLYVYFNLLHKLSLSPNNSYYLSFMETSIKNSKTLLRVLIDSSKSLEKEKSTYAKTALGQLIISWNRFVLPENIRELLVDLSL